VEFVRAVHEAGAGIVYLTGRDEPGMGRGTRKSFEDARFSRRRRARPAPPQAQLARGRPGLQALGPRRIREHGEVVAAFENEPANANLFPRGFPRCPVVLIDTVCSPDPPPLAPGIVRLKDFVV
jgi:hypothetical protein